MAHGALIGIEARPESGGVGQGDDVRLRRIDGGPQRQIGAVVAGRLQLDGALQPTRRTIHCGLVESTIRFGGAALSPRTFVKGNTRGLSLRAERAGNEAAERWTTPSSRRTALTEGPIVVQRAEVMRW